MTAQQRGTLQLQIMRLLSERKKKTFTAKEISEEIGHQYKAVSSHLFALFGKGCVSRRRCAKIFRYRFREWGDVRETEESARKRENSDLVERMAIWDIAVKAAVQRSEHSKEAFS